MEILKRFTKDRSNLLPMLQAIQADEKFIKPEVIREIGIFLDISENDIYSLVSFYPDLHLVQQGRHIVRVCHCLSCYLHGGQSLLEKVKSELKINVGHTSSDLKVSLERTFYPACSSLSPVLIIDDKVYTCVGPLGVRQLLKQHDI